MRTMNARAVGASALFLLASRVAGQQSGPKPGALPPPPAAAGRSAQTGIKAGTVVIEKFAGSNDGSPDRSERVFLFPIRLRLFKHCQSKAVGVGRRDVL